MQLEHDNYVFVSARLQQWSGKRSLSFDQEIGVSNADKIFQGTKAICPPDLLKPFHAVERFLSMSFDRIGFRFFGSNIWAIPVSRIDEADDLLNRIKERFDKALETFKTEYDDAFENFVREKENASLLRSAKLPLDICTARFNMLTARFQVADSPYSSGVGTEALKDAFILSVTKQAEEAFLDWEERKNKSVLSSKSLNILRMLRDKIHGFKFLTPKAEPLVQHLESVLRTLPTDRNLVGEEIERAYAVICLLKDANSLYSFSSALIDNKRAELAEEIAKPENLEDGDSIIEPLPSILDEEMDLDGAVPVSVQIQRDPSSSASEPAPEIPSPVIPAIVITDDDIPLAEEEDDAEPGDSSEIPDQGDIPLHAPF
jgi:hypothetical protein